MIIDVKKMNMFIAENKMTLSRLAEVSGVSRNTLTRINNGKKVTPIIVGKISSALNCEIIDLIN